VCVYIRECQKSDWARHKSQCHLRPEVVGLPFVISIAASQATYTALYDMAVAYARCVLLLLALQRNMNVGRRKCLIIEAVEWK
jgi:hypothetical protein